MTTSDETMPEPAPRSGPRAVPTCDAIPIADLLVFDGLKFVENLYWTILRRAPDVRGLATCLHLLLLDRKSKREIVLLIRSSEEARRTGFELIEDTPTKPKTSPFDLPPIDPSRRRYHANELQNFNGEQFITVLYRCLLKRDPDDQVLHGIQDVLVSGQCGKKDVVAMLADSPEGRNSGVVVDGVWRERIVLRLIRLPLLGAAIRFLATLVSTGQVDRRLRANSKGLGL